MEDSLAGSTVPQNEDRAAPAKILTVINELRFMDERGGL